MVIMVSQTSALERVLRPMDGDLPRQVAEYLLRLDFTPADHARYLDLSHKAQEGTLSQGEKRELEDLLTTNDVLTILRSKARASLARRHPAT